jgi:hypothetical protein
MAFVRAYPRESQEMVFDAHSRAFEFFKGACTRGIYDNMKTAVEAVFIGKDRQFNRRFLQMCGHYLVEPVDVAAHVCRTDEPLAPLGNGGLGPVPLGHLGSFRLDPVAACLAPHDQPHSDRSRVPERHRRAGCRFHNSG